jgi:hypothetical protein
VKILFVLHHAGVTPFARTLGLLADRGHSVHVLFQRVKTADSMRDLQQLADEQPGITYGDPRGRRSSSWTPLSRKLADTVDYLRYLEPRYRDAEKLRARARDNAPVAGLRLARWAPTGLLKPSLAWTERCLPPPPEIEDYLREGGWDLLLVTPLIELGSSQSDWLRAARRLGVRTGYPVLSWDNLTNKGLLRDIPDRVFVWNEVQAQEAVELHGVPRERVVVTGAQTFDQWFDREPSRSREQFCAEVGLRPDRPIVLYLCSSGFVAPDEPAFVRRYLADLRARGGPLAEAGVLVRPHPLFTLRWDGVDLGDPQAVIWPPHGEDPSSEAGGRNYFDAMSHAAAVVGINTTAQIEAAIVGRPVHTVLAEEFRTTQEGTLHFHYLEEGVIVGRTFDEHAAQLEESLAGRPVDNERFLRWFVRPLGLDVNASEQLASAIEELGREPAPAPDHGPALGRPVRLALRPAARVAERRVAHRRRVRRSVKHPAHHIRRRALNMGAHKSGAPAVFGPWLGDEVGELLYWIPYLRWAQHARGGFRDRMYMLRRPGRALWYEGIGTRQVEVEPPVTKADLPGLLGVKADRYLHLTWNEVEAARDELSRHTPDPRIMRRLLLFEPLRAPETTRELPPSFVAVRGLDVPGVRLDDLDSEQAAAVIARAESYVGPYGAETFVASLLGVPATVVRRADDPDADRDLRLASYFLDRAPFGAIEAVEQLPAPALR